MEKEQNLFGFSDAPKITDEAFEKVCKTALDGISRKRQNHILAVRDEALFAAKIFFRIFNVDDTRLRDIECMALLHDITKEMPIEKQTAFCERNGFVLSKEDLACPTTVHSVSGAAAAKELYDMPRHISDAVLKHTVGAENMTLSDKIIFLADYIEPTREYEACKKLREIFHRELHDLKTEEQALNLIDKCVCLAALQTVEMLVERQQNVHPTTILTVKNICLEHLSKSSSKFEFEKEKEEFRCIFEREEMYRAAISGEY